MQHGEKPALVKGDSQQPGYITCARSSCTTVEYKALTRKHIERLGYDIVQNWGDQWSDLQGGFADHAVKLPNPTYYLPSPDLPGVHEPWLAPRTYFTMQPDGSSGRIPDGEGIPNIDSVKATIRTYYGDAGNGISDKDQSSYITEMNKIINRQTGPVLRQCRQESQRHRNPAVVLDADDTTLWTYDMEAGAGRVTGRRRLRHRGECRRPVFGSDRRLRRPDDQAAEPDVLPALSWSRASPSRPTAARRVRWASAE